MLCAHGIPQWGGDRVSRVASSSWNALVFFQLLSTKADNGALTSPLLPLPLLLPLPPSLPLRPFLPPPPLQCSPWTLSANWAARSSLPRRQAPLPPRPPSRRYCPPWRAHHFLFPHRHMPPPQPWPFFPPLAFWTSPQITVSFPLLLLFPLPPLLHFLGVELR